jgi:hypothetical protein
MPTANNPANADTRFFQTNETAIVSNNHRMLTVMVYTSSSTYVFPYRVSCVEGISTNNTSIYEKLKSSALLDSFLSLNDNWNGYGARKFDPEFIDVVKKIVFKLEKNPKIFPTGRNSIQLEYQKDNGDYLELEVFPDCSVATLQIIGDEEYNSKIQVTEINSLLQSFYAI